MSSPPWATSQLVSNRVLLNQVSSVVRRNKNEKKSNFTSDSKATNSESFRLLLGPDSNKFIKTSLENIVTADDSRNSELEEKRINDKKLLSNLVPSRLKTPYKPFDIDIKQLDALNLPNDLLIHVGPPGSVANYNILSASLKKRPKSGKRIFKPLSSDISSLKNSLKSVPLTPKHYPTSFDDEFLLPESLMQNISKRNKNITKTDDIVGAVNFDDLDAKVETSIKIHEKSRKTVEEYFGSKERNVVVKIRQMFYVIRCYANYNINMKHKVAFITDVNDTRILLSSMNAWHSYTSKMNMHRLLSKQIVDLSAKRKLLSRFYYWKEHAKDFIRLARIAADNLRKLRLKLLFKSFREFRSMTKSRKHCRFDVIKLFRYNINGPFRPLNKYYHEVRTRVLKAYHFNFLKCMTRAVRAWRKKVIQIIQDKKKTMIVYIVIRRLIFSSWYNIYRHHFHQRIMIEVRSVAKNFIAKSKNNEREKVKNIENSWIAQLKHDRAVFEAKLTHFDPLVLNHKRAINSRKNARTEIFDITSDYFRRQEELSLVDSFRIAKEASYGVKEFRLQLAGKFLDHVDRVIKNYNSQFLTNQFYISFHAFSNPILERAISHFYEKKVLRRLILTCIRRRNVLNGIYKCSILFHKFFGYSKWKEFMLLRNIKRTPGLMNQIRRRIEILKLYPYFNWIECLPVRPPKPIREVQRHIKDLSSTSIQKKVANERMHYVNVKVMLYRRRLLRDFIRAYASLVQERISVRNVIILMKRRKALCLVRISLHKLYVNAKKIEYFQSKKTIVEETTQNDIDAWFLHFFAERIRQHNIVTDSSCL